MGNFWGLAAVLTLCGGVVACAIKYPPPTSEDIEALENERIAARLPDGCTVHQLGGIGDVDEVVAVMCDGRKVIATSAETTRTVNVGKGLMTEHDTSVVLMFPDAASKDGHQ